MSVNHVSINPTNESPANSATQSANLNGRGVSDVTRRRPGMLKGFLDALVTTSIIFAALVSSLAIGISTGALQGALIAVTVVSAAAALTSLYLFATNSRL